uniref:hypothetical protein n=1 Tax=Kutzneria viridogrisea TaxID=47990 RepID=UPI0016037421
MALHQATSAASARPSSSPDPASAAAGASAAKTPAPIIAPSPITTASTDAQLAPQPHRSSSAEHVDGAATGRWPPHPPAR